jgi:hypothetical protein
MDELAEKLDIDPVELRRINDTTTRQAPTTGCGRVGRRGARSPVSRCSDTGPQDVVLSLTPGGLPYPVQRDWAKLKLTIKKLRHEQFGQSSERGALLDQLELQLADLEENAAQAETAAQMAAAQKIVVPSFERRRPARRPLPGHLPHERIVYPAPSVCPCCGGGTLRKIGEDVTETLELIPRQWKVIQLY